MGEGYEARLLQRAAGSGVRCVAAGTGNGAELVSGALQFLDKKRAQSPAAKRFVHLHVNIAVRAVVVKEDPALAGFLTVDF